MLDYDFGRVFSGVSKEFLAIISKINQSYESEFPHYGSSKHRRAWSWRIIHYYTSKILDMHAKSDGVTSTKTRIYIKADVISWYSAVYNIFVVCEMWVCRDWQYWDSDLLGCDIVGTTFSLRMQHLPPKRRYLCMKINSLIFRNMKNGLFFP
jgi:hypothetical protein